MAGNYMQDLYEETFGKKPKTTAGTLYENAATPETAGFSRKRTYIDDLYDETFRKNPEAPLDVYGQRARVTNRWAAAPGHDDPAKVDQVQAELSKYLGDAAPPRGLLTLSQLEERLRIAKADAATGTAPYTAKWVVTEGENSRVPYGIPGLAAVENAFYKVSDAVRSALPKGHPDNKLDVNDPLYTYAAGPGAIVGYAAQAEPKALMRTIRDAPGLVGGGAVSGGAGFLGVLRMVSDNFENLDPPLMRVMKGIGETLKAHGYAPPVDYNEAGYVLMQLAEDMQGKTPEDAGPIERSARTALTSTGQVLPLLAASAAAGPTAAPYFAASMGVSAAGQTYLRRTKEDGPSASAAMHAVLDGIFEGAFEMAGGQVTLFDRAAWAKSFLGALAKMVAREVPSEVATTFMQNYDAWMFEHPEKSAKDWLAEQPQDALETALSTLMGAGVQSAIAHGTMAAVDRINGNHRAEKEASALHEMFAAATEAELFHSDPQRFEEFFQGASQNAEVRIDASVLGNALEAAGKTKDDIPALVEQGDLPGDITVPVASLVSTFAGTTEEGTIVQNVRMDPEAQTIAERRAAGNSALDAFMSMGRKALEERQADQRFKGAYDALKEELAADLGATGVYKPGAVDSFADMTATLYSVTASRMGVTPLQLRDGWTDSNGVEHRGYNLLARNQKGPIARPVANATMADFTPGRIGNILRRGNWAVITAENPQGKTLTPEENAARQVALKAELDRLGVEYEQIEGKYVEDGQEEIAPLEHPFLVLGMGTNDALALGNKFDRDSVLTREGVVYSDGTVHRAGSVTEHAVEPRNYWSRVPSTGATFTANLDFSKKVPLSDVQNSGELYQNVQEPQGTFSPDTLEYSLLAKADLSTFMHEVGHFALTMYMDLARDIESRVLAGVKITAGEQGILDDMLAVLEWMGGEMPAVAGAPGVFEQKVWHGTPNMWAPEPGFPHGRPRLDKIGTGEGAQAFGWGWYSAESQGVAKYYLMEQFGPMPPTGLLAAAVSIRHKYKDDAKKVAFMKQMWPEYSDKEIADAIAQSKELQPVNESSLYQLDIPDATLPHLLDWDKPLGEQTPEVRKALEPWLATWRADKMALLKVFGQDAARKEVAQTEKELTGETVYQAVGLDKGSDKAASEYLASLGIVGNRYLDGQSRNRPLKDIKREFLAELPEDADFDEVSELIGTGRFSPKNDALLKALRDDEWLGFDYPAQAISAALSKDLGNYDTSPALLRAVADAQEGATFNFVIWDQPTLDEIAMLERNGEKLDAISAADLFPEEFADEENFREENGEDSYVVFDPKQVASALGSTWVRGDVGANILKQGETPATPAPGKLTLAAWAAMSTEQQRPYHEKFAETWEQYLFTGKAPTKKMEGLMRRLSDWMRRVYITMKGLVAKRQLADLNPELSAVMDRMVATEQEISDALARRTSEALFRSAVEAGMTPEQFSAYMALSDSAKAEAEERLRARAMRDLKWMENRRNKAIAALQKEAAEARKKVREQVAKEVANTPLFRAIRWLRHGVIDNPDTGEEIQSLQGHKLKISDLEAMYPAGAVDSSVDWKKLGYGKYGMLAAEGLHPDIIAHMVGFQTGYELVSALIEAPSFKQEVEGITDQRMLSEHGDLATPEGIAKAADEAIMNDTRTKFLATELSRLVTHLGSPAAIARAAMAYAKATVDNHIVGKLRPNTFTADAARAGKASLLAFGKGDIDGAAAAKRTEILNHATAREAYAVEKEIKAMISKLQKMAQATDESAAAKARDMDVVNAVRVILSSYGIGSSAKGEQAATYLDNLRTLEPVIADELKGLVDAATQNKKDWKKLKVSELRDLFTDVSGVWELAKRSQQQVVDGKRVERASIVQQLVDRLQTRHPATQGASSGNRALTKAEQRKVKFSTIKALFRRVSDWAESMDGGRKMGPFRRYIWFPLKDAADRYRIDKEQKLTEYHALLEAVKDSFNGKAIDGRPYGVDYIFGGGEVDGMSELLHALLHTGNESNKRKLLLGRGWATKNADGTLDTVNWDRFIHAMQANGTLTKAHYDFVQGVWDLLESTKPLAQRAHRAVFGRSFNEITAEKFITPWGEYRGGYVPAQADTDKVTDAAARALANQANENMTYSFPLPASGFAKNRVEYNVPLRLDLRTLAGHLDKVLLFSHLAEPAADVRRLLMNKELAAELKRVDPSVVESMLTPWLERSAKQIIETQDPSNKGLARIFSVVRTRAGITAMMANFVNTLQQLTGFATIMSKVDGKYMMESLAQHVANPADSYAFVTENSNYMRLRLEQGSIAMSGDIVDVLTNPGKYDRAVDWVRKHAYFMQTGIDQVITPVMWTAVYKQALGEAEGTPAQRHLDAVRLANDAVAQTQGSQFAEEVAKFEVGSPFYRMFMQFTGFFNAQANWMGTEFAKVARDMGLKKGLGRGLYIYLLGAAIPAIVSEAIVQAFRGGPPDDDKDGEYLDDWISSLMLGTLRYQAAMAPVVGPAAMALANTFNNKSYDDRISTSPAISMIESSFQGVRELYDAVADNESSKKPSRVIMDSATLVSMVLGVPIRTLAKPFAYGADVEVGKVSPTGPLDYTRGLLTGVASPESKQ